MVRVKAGAQPHVMEAPALVHSPSLDPRAGRTIFSISDTQPSYVSMCDRVRPTDTMSYEAGSGVPLSTGSVPAFFPRPHDALSHQQTAAE